MPSLAEISAYALADETTALDALLPHLADYETKRASIRAHAEALVTPMRQQGGGGVESFLQEYGLDTKEGVAIMCLAEALLRIPDSATADRLIEDTFTGTAWKHHLGKSDSLFVNASTWGLLISGTFVQLDEDKHSIGGLLSRLTKSLGEPVLRQSLKTAMGLIGRQFVLGETIEQAIARAKPHMAEGYRLSYDILGEGARTAMQAEAYATATRHAIQTLAAEAKGKALFDAPSLSIKLSGLFPRYQWLQRERVMEELYPRLATLIAEARGANLTVALDAEEATRLDLQLLVIERLLTDPQFTGDDGIGVVVQAYQKRAFPVIAWLRELAERQRIRLPVRLVKGAYWDSEIKHAQLAGLAGYPVFTRKAHTDVSYLACAQALLASPQQFYPQFATHNALTAAAIMETAPHRDFEFQRLHGMGDALHDQLLREVPSRIYAPVGHHRELLAYLIRRLLENGANTSFVHALMDRELSLDALLQDPIAQARQGHFLPAPHIPLPQQLYGSDRANSQGIDWGMAQQVETLEREVKKLRKPLPVVADSAAQPIDAALQQAVQHFPAWETTPVSERAAILERAADLFEAHRAELIALLINEARKTHGDALSEVREAADFCRYYAARARELFVPQLLIGATGERNVHTLHGRGVVLAISPWNFPFAIFTGQVVAALAAGNSVIAKPAEQTPRIAQRAVELLHHAGVPQGALQTVTGKGETVGAQLVADARVDMVVFTGSTGAAKAIQRSLAVREGAIIPLIAETGGQNAMVVDSSALLEHAVDDIIASAFGSAGQRCSALRILLVQDDIADALWSLLEGAMRQLRVGDPGDLATDIPPVIDREAQQRLFAHITRMKGEARRFVGLNAPASDTDSFVPPHMFEIASVTQLTEEQFGPILHVLPYRREQLAAHLADLQRTDYGLTFGLHSRIPQSTAEVLEQVTAGNVYVNRSMIGATVGVQPFGGHGLSGTGPKAGGVFYLPRFTTERHVSTNTAAIGGNLDLLSGA